MVLGLILCLEFTTDGVQDEKSTVGEHELYIVVQFIIETILVVKIILESTIYEQN